MQVTRGKFLTNAEFFGSCTARPRERQDVEMIIEVDRKDLHRSRVVDDDARDLQEGQARLRIDAFALTANNITYGAFGDALQYWNFFPAVDEWGRIPVWGFADVVESRVGDVPVGQRVYGYFPMGDELVVEPGKVDDAGFSDLAAHRQAMAPIYSRYARVDAQGMYERAREGHQMVLWPLFFTSFLIDDFIDDGGFGASTVVFSSASSKTAIGSAFLGHERPGVRVVGLTSARNRAFVASLGCYDVVVAYGDEQSLPDGAAAFVDIAGNRDVVAGVHRRYGDDLRLSLIVGGTHWDHDAAVGMDPLPGPTPEFFFAPTQGAKRADDWGQDALDKKVGDAWHRFITWTDGWLELREVRGPEGVERTYHELLAGNIDPRVGYVCSMTS
jgi:hypothetical protein